MRSPGRAAGAASGRRVSPRECLPQQCDAGRGRLAGHAGAAPDRPLVRVSAGQPGRLFGAWPRAARRDQAGCGLWPPGVPVRGRPPNRCARQRRLHTERGDCARDRVHAARAAIDRAECEPFRGKDPANAELHGYEIWRNRGRFASDLRIADQGKKLEVFARTFQTVVESGSVLPSATAWKNRISSWQRSLLGPRGGRSRGVSINTRPPAAAARPTALLRRRQPRHRGRDQGCGTENVQRHRAVQVSPLIGPE